MRKKEKTTAPVVSMKKRTSSNNKVVSNKASNNKTTDKRRNDNIKFSSTVMINERKKKKRVFKIITIFVVIGLIITSIYLLLTLEEFKLKSINLNETEKYSKDEIIQKADLEIGKNTFISFFTCDRKTVTTLPYVESIKLKIKMPNQIDIEVVERTGKYYAYDKDNNIFYKLSEDGYILESVDINSKTQNEILVTGITFDNEVMLGKKINDTDLSKLGVYKKIEEEFKNSKINGNITKVSFENSLTTITINDKLNVIFPNDTDLEYKMSFLKGILAKIGESSVGVIDMTKTNPTYSSF